MEDDGQFAGDRDLRFLEAIGLRKPESPGLQRREGDPSSEDRVGRFKEVGSRHSIATLGDPAIPTDLSGVVAPRRQSEKGADARRSPEAGGVVVGGGDREGGHRTDTGGGHEQTGRGVLPRDATDPAVENLDPVEDGTAGLKERLHDSFDLGGGDELTGDDLFGTPSEASDLLPKHDAEGLQEPADFVLDLGAYVDKDVPRR